MEISYYFPGVILYKNNSQNVIDFISIITSYTKRS